MNESFSCHSSQPAVWHPEENKVQEFKEQSGVGGDVLLEASKIQGGKFKEKQFPRAAPVDHHRCSLIACACFFQRLLLWQVHALG